MKPAITALLIQVSLLWSLSAAAQAPNSQGEWAGCAVPLLDQFELPAADHPRRESANRALLSEIDLAYADALATEFRSSVSKRTAKLQCQLDRYRARARTLEPLRVATKRAYEQARSVLESEERIASSLCLPYEFGSRAWKKCERAAAAHRSKLRSRLRAAQSEWHRVDKPPDYQSEDGKVYWVTRAEARKRIDAAGRVDRSIEPRHLGPEVWCGDSNLRRADTLLAPESEFMRVTVGIEAARRNLRNYQERYAQALELEREAIGRMERPIRARALGSQIEKLDEIRVAIEGWGCQAAWHGERARELSGVPDAAELAYLDAKEIFDRLETQCDAFRPKDKKWILAGTRAGPWIECLKSVESERDEKLHSLETKRSLHEATLQAAFKVGSRE